MADNNKKYANWVDATNGQNPQRIWFRDAEAQAAIEEVKEEISQLDPASAASIQTCEAIVDELT